MSVPVLTPEQRDQALDMANTIRAGQSELKRNVVAEGRRGAAVLADALEAVPSFLARKFVWQMLLWVPRLGEVTAARLLKAARIDPWARAGRLTSRQRGALVEGLRAHAVGVGPGGYRRKPSPSGAGPRRRGNPTCQGCGEHLRERTESGLCGFCEGDL